MGYETTKRSYPGTEGKSARGAFGYGYIDNTPDLFLIDGASPYLRNARQEGQSIIIRPGFQTLSTLTAGSYPKGIGSYLQSDSANDRLVVRHNTDATHKLYTIKEDGTATSIDTSTNIASDNRMRFTNIANVVYCMNGSDPFGKLSTTTYTVPSTGIVSFAPAFSVVFNGSHWASGRSTNPNKVYKSVADNYEDFNSSGSDQFTFQETITGLSTNTQSLFYFTKNTISVTAQTDIQVDTSGNVTYLTRPLEVKEGAVNNACIVEAGSNIYYRTPSNKINQIARGANLYGYEVNELSGRKYAGIDKLLSTLSSDQSTAFGYYLPDADLIKRHVKSQGATFNDIVIVYDVIKDIFLVDTQKYFFDGVHFKNANYTISMIEPKVFRDEYSQDDTGVPIPFEYWTKKFYLEPTRRKRLRETRTLADINELASLTQEIFMDGVSINTKTVDIDNIPVYSGGIGTESIGTYSVGTGGDTDNSDYNSVTILRTKGSLNKRCNYFQFRFTNGTLAGKVRLNSIAYKAEVLPELATPLTQ